MTDPQTPDLLADLFAQTVTPERDAAFAAEVSGGVARARMERRGLTVCAAATAVLLIVGLTSVVGELMDGAAVAVLTACGVGAAWIRANA